MEENLSSKLGHKEKNMILQRNQWNVGAPGRASVPRATGPVRGTESQCFSFGERFALEKFNAHRLEWLVGTLSLPGPGFALGVLVQGPMTLLGPFFIPSIDP